MKQQRKDQTEEQRTMLMFAMMVYERRKRTNDFALLTQAVKDVWRIYPEGYKNITSFFQAAARLARKSVNS